MPDLFAGISLEELLTFAGMTSFLMASVWLLWTALRDCQRSRLEDMRVMHLDMVEAIKTLDKVLERIRQ